jgi:uncharacterized protein (TIGR04255 family)
MVLAVSETEPAYTAPPIIEAVIQLMYHEPLSASMFRKLGKRLARGYANEKAASNINAKIEFANRTAEFEEHPQLRLSSSDEADILIVQHHALTWSRLAPYQGWDPFIERVQAEAQVAGSVTGLRKLSRMGVRYINRLDVPRIDDVVHYEQYLAINISLPQSIPIVHSYAWRFERHFQDENLLAIVQSATVEPEVPDTGAFILDIDVVARDDIPVKLEDILAKLGQMRSLKNELFELSIRDEARASFS